jgi:hypothetical protein
MSSRSDLFVQPIVADRSNPSDLPFRQAQHEPIEFGRNLDLAG